MVKQNITLSVDSTTYTNFKIECMKKGITFSEQISKFLEGFASNTKITDFNTFQESTNPFLDQPIEAIDDFVRNLTPHRAVELLWKSREWETRLNKR